MKTRPFHITEREQQHIVVLRALLACQSDALIKAADLLLDQQNTERHTPAQNLFVVEAR